MDHAQQGFHNDQDADGAEQHRFRAVSAIGIQDRWNHEDKGKQQDRQVKLPVFRQRHAGLHEKRRHDYEHGVEHDVQYEDSQIQAQQLGIEDAAQHPFSLG